LQYSPEDFSLQNYLGVQYYNNGQYDEAIKQFLLSTEIAPYWDQNWNYLGQTYERVGELKGEKKLLQKAKIAYHRAIENSVNNDAPYANMAHLLLFTNEPSAKTFMNRSLKQFPHSSQLWYYLAVYEISKNNKEDALINAKNAVLNNPYNQEAKDLYSALVQGVNINIQLGK
jgi:tetratricopeptide (TPR) repeat protein